MRKTYVLDGLCCPKCAKEINSAAKKISGVQSTEVDFANTSITIVFSGDEKTILQALIGICEEIDEDITVREG
jgi:Cd2+/Zn2+-exporting ATPase